jgi:hypothetical protein
MVAQIVAARQSKRWIVWIYFSVEFMPQRNLGALRRKKRTPAMDRRG